MLELLKKGFFASIGAAVLTKEKIEEATRRLVEEGKLSSEESEKLAEDLVRAGEQQWEEINEKTTSTWNKWTESLEFVRKKEFDELKKRVELLEERLTALQNPPTEPGEP